jgi:hypothetical protein
MTVCHKQNLCSTSISTQPASSSTSIAMASTNSPASIACNVATTVSPIVLLARLHRLPEHLPLADINKYRVHNGLSMVRGLYWFI